MLHIRAKKVGWSAAQIARATRQKGDSSPCVDFITESTHCPVCHGELEIQKSKQRIITTLESGKILAKEIRKRCCADSTHPVLTSQALACLVPRQQRYGYDLIVWVGLARYLRNKQRSEIRTELLHDHDITLSDGTVSALCDRFLKYLESLHLNRSPALRQAMGDYPLHIDATSEHGKGGLFLCINGWRGWVLHAVKIASENENELRPAIERTVSLFGDPIAIMRDLGSAGAKAVDGLRQRGVPDLACHYHFLGAVGKQLFDHHYSILSSLLRQSKVRAKLRETLCELRQNSNNEVYKGKFGNGRVRQALLALILWVLEDQGKKDLPYPFSLPHLNLYQRCREMIERAERWMPLPRTQVERAVLKHLKKLITSLDELERLVWAVPKLEQSWQSFCELRDILRLTDAELPRGDLRYLTNKDFPELEAERLECIETATRRYHKDIRQRAEELDSKHANAVILTYLDRYIKQLFGHPSQLDDNGKVVAIVERTNNVAEHFFGSDKQKLRRRLGRAHLGRDLEDQPAQAVLASNLLHGDYVRVLCGSLDNMPSAFAELDLKGEIDASPLERKNRDTLLIKHISTLLEGEETLGNCALIGDENCTIEELTTEI